MGCCRVEAEDAPCALGCPTASGHRMGYWRVGIGPCFCFPRFQWGSMPREGAGRQPIFSAGRSQPLFAARLLFSDLTAARACRGSDYMQPAARVNVKRAARPQSHFFERLEGFDVSGRKNASAPPFAGPGSPSDASACAQLRVTGLARWVCHKAPRRLPFIRTPAGDSSP